MRTTHARTQELKSAHRQAIALLVEQFEASQPSIRTIPYFLEQITQTTDQTLTDLWRNSAMPSDMTLVAMGGYGRAELFPYSDVDVLILLPSQIELQQDDQTRAKVESFIQRCWDLGIHIGSSVRTLKESLNEAQKDITIQTAQLESRLITGNKELFVEFQRKFIAQLNSNKFVQEKLREMRYRHQKYEDTPYALEPNCKESPGGLRDLHVILWITKATRLGNNWAELEKNGLITKLETRQLQHNEAWLKLVRAHLHLLTHRHEDRLVFDVQEQIAQRLGYEADGIRRASEVFMRRYYRTAKTISQINQIFILSIAERVLQKHGTQPRPIDAHFADLTGALDITDDNLYYKDTHQILRTFLLYVQQRGLKTLSARTFRALYNARRLMNASFRKDPVNAQTFMEILKAPHGITHAFRLMNQTSVLGRYLWPFRSIVGQMQHDLFHVYTVDQHTLMVLRNIRRFFLPEHAHEYPLCSEIAAGFNKPWLLYIAALFHDIAKGRGGDHSLLGAQDVVTFAKAHDINETDTQFLEFLVTEHLTMSRIAQKEDTGDPEVIHNFVKKVKDEHHLNALYLLTVADIRGTSPKVWNSWKAHLLEHLYKLSLHVLGGHVPEPGALIATRKRLAYELLEKVPFPKDKAQTLWATLGVNYFMRHEARDIAWHTQMLWDKVASPEPLVYVRTLDNNTGIQVLVYSPDQADLFARICSYFSMTELSVVDARIHTTYPYKNQPGWALDTFQLLPDYEQIEINEPAALEKSIAINLQKTLQQNAPLPQPRISKRISRRAKYFPLPPMISFTPDESHQRWLLNIIAGDRVGLLYVIAHILAKRQIHVELAKIFTLGDRIEDTFLISSPQLANHTYQAELEQELSQAIQSG